MPLIGKNWYIDIRDIVVKNQMESIYIDLKEYKIEKVYYPSRWKRFLQKIGVKVRINQVKLRQI